MHTTVLTKGKCDNLLKEPTSKCPFCKYTSMPPMVHYHIKNHLQLAVTHLDFTIVKCNLHCRPKSHFHCCYCSETVIQRSQLLLHIANHSIKFSPNQPQTPATLQPRTPATLQPLTPATLQPRTPSDLQPRTSTALQPLTPATLQPLTPATLQPRMPSDLQPRTSTALQPLTPATLQPLTPATLQPLTPATLQPLTPATLQPLTPATLQPLRPAILQPRTPSDLQPLTPAILQPRTTSDLQPRTSTALQPLTPATLQPRTPADLQPRTSTALQPLTPASLQPLTPANRQPRMPATLQPLTPAALQPRTSTALQPLTPATLQPLTPATLQLQMAGTAAAPQPQIQQPETPPTQLSQLPDALQPDWLTVQQPQSLAVLPKHSAKRTVSCSQCNLTLLAKNLRVHIARQHTDIEKHFQSQCIDCNIGIFAVQKAFHSQATPIHVIKNTQGRNQRTECELEECNLSSQFAPNSGILPPECSHVKSLSFCAEVDHPNVTLTENSLSQLVQQKWFGEARKAQLLLLQQHANTADTHLSVHVTVGGPSSKYFISVFEPEKSYYSRMGRVMVTFEKNKNSWYCPCAKPRQSCMHKDTAKWHLFQMLPGLFMNVSSSEEVLNAGM